MPIAKRKIVAEAIEEDVPPNAKAITLEALNDLGYFYTASSLRLPMGYLILHELADESFLPCELSLLFYEAKQTGIILPHSYGHYLRAPFADDSPSVSAV